MGQRTLGTFLWWRGSVTDLITDLKGAMTVSEFNELVSRLSGAAISKTFDEDEVPTNKLLCSTCKGPLYLDGQTWRCSNLKEGKCG